MATLQSKRKRESQDVGAARVAPAMAQQPSTDFSQHYMQTTDDNDIDFSGLVHSNADESGDVQHNAGHIQVQGTNEGAPGTASDTAAAAMAQFQAHTMTVPQSTEATFLNSAGDGGEGQTEGGSGAQGRNSSFGADFDLTATHASPNGDGSPSGAAGSAKPTVGSDEWHKQRKDNHKEVERRRRETINEGISELSKIVPGCEKNKGSILQRAVQFITQLKENETQNIEKWTLEKLLTEQAIAELSSSCDKLKAECSRAWSEVEQWKSLAQKNGLTLDDDTKGDDDGEGGNED